MPEEKPWQPTIALESPLLSLMLKINEIFLRPTEEFDDRTGVRAGRIMDNYLSSLISVIIYMINYL